MTSSQLGTPSAPQAFDVVIVGSGPVGATFAREIASAHPTATIAMIEMGPALGDPPGANVKNVADLDLRAELQRRAQGPSQRHYGVSSLADRARANVRPDLAKPDSLARPGTFLVSSTGADSTQMPAAAMSANVGGMGAHWTCACPWPYGDERIAELDANWDAFLDRARELLSVSSSAYALDEGQRALLGRLGQLFPGGEKVGRGPQALPMALRSTQEGIQWVGASDILGDLLGDSRFTLMANTLCERIVTDHGSATGVVVRPEGENSRELSARFVVIAADPVRTPQLLWASGIRPRALGRYLNEHAQVISGVAIDPAIVPPSETGAGVDPVSGVLWIPYVPGSFPYHGQLTSLQAAPLQLLNSAKAGSTVMTMSWFCPTEVDEQNRVEFSDSEVDVFGLPRPTIHFRRSEEDARRVAEAMRLQTTAARELGSFTSASGPVLMPPGSSLHYTGTTRIGAQDDGTSVCNADSRVWGTSNVYVGGSGTIPTAVAGNPTLTSVAIAVRSARSIGSALKDHD